MRGPDETLQDPEGAQVRRVRQEDGLRRPRLQVGALAGTSVAVISNPGRCRSANRGMLTGQHTDLCTGIRPLYDQGTQPAISGRGFKLGGRPT